LTIGKKIGIWAFVISEILAVGFLVVCLILKILSADIVTAILLFQGTIFSVVWGAKASKNFSKGNQCG